MGWVFGRRPQRQGNAITPLCPAGHLPHKGGDRQGAATVLGQPRRRRAEHLSIQSPPLRGRSHMAFDGAALPFSPVGRRWPEGSDEGVARIEPLRLRHPPHPPAGTFSPRGRRGWSNGFLPCAIAQPLRGRCPAGQRRACRHASAKGRHP
nr:hypothetical protein SHINE37_40617 [Rhizobiaceae bacterium]